MGLQQTSIIQRSINRLRKGVLGVMQKSFGNDKPVLGIAEALLIGYKDHLDRDLVQEYTQAGVVHIIAISGLHLGLIYWMITALLARIIDQEEASYTIHTEFYSPMAVHHWLREPPSIRTEARSCSAACCWGRPCLNDQPSCRH
ncbi:MAG: ComEC/Rec2 family competence protein [Ferruginibacter sp.]